ncbi:MAG: DUF411 domain-containing protein [Phenylobacterium sp.]|uniref:DUF411 domain-containing protein n=1 Tax=Phenylobacterium sp. TaxID=1871053 RepID=UPI00121EBA57|nr:DUF411 domain-containing protein [Phenylobacterium sp.]TAJ68794.1 MAG: DUF411 domain-containing protein [Phenylobacterium sp.]
MPILPLNRRALFGGAVGLLATTGACAQAEVRELTVYKTPWCGCCGGWVTHMTRAGFQPKVVELEDLAPIRAKHGVPFVLSSCHTGVIDGYVVEGHVPPADVVRLLRERPKGLGLVVPGMPIGSPGMEQPGGHREPFKTLLLLDRSGRTRPFASHA